MSGRHSEQEEVSSVRHPDAPVHVAGEAAGDEEREGDGQYAGPGAGGEELQSRRRGTLALSFGSRMQSSAVAGYMTPVGLPKTCVVTRKAPTTMAIRDARRPRSPLQEQYRAEQSKNGVKRLALSRPLPPQPQVVSEPQRSGGGRPCRSMKDARGASRSVVGARSAPIPAPQATWSERSNSRKRRSSSPVKSWIPA